MEYDQVYVQTISVLIVLFVGHNISRIVATKTYINISSLLNTTATLHQDCIKMKSMRTSITIVVYGIDIVGMVVVMIVMVLSIVVN